MEKPRTVDRFIGFSWSTAQIVTYVENQETGTGTGFFYQYTFNERSVTCVITNKHVINDCDEVGLILSTSHEPGMRAPGPGQEIRRRIDQLVIFAHPDNDVDLVAIPVQQFSSVLLSKTGKNSYVVSLDETNMPTSDFERTGGATDDVYMIGYPIGLIDDHNNVPIIRKGIVSTPYSQKYKGKDDFLIDISCFPGSSGSPIITLVERDGFEYITLLGVLHSGHMHSTEGELIPGPVPTHRSNVWTTIPVNLGICVKACKIRDFGPAVLARLLASDKIRATGQP
jgi:hypothetical protein